MGVIATVLKVAAPVAALGYMLAGSSPTGVEKEKTGAGRRTSRRSPPKRRQAKASRKSSRKTRRAKKRQLLKEVREETRH